jgi:hypothetical protein
VRDETLRRTPAPALYQPRFKVPAGFTAADTEIWREWALQERAKYFAQVEAACWDRWVTNYDDPGGEGSTAQHIAILRAIIGELGQRGWFAYYRGELVEHNASFDPPTNAIRVAEALTEALDRRMSEAYGSITQVRSMDGWVLNDRNEDYESDHPLGLWPLCRLGAAETSYGSWNHNGIIPFSPREFPARDVREALLAKRWPVAKYEPGSGEGGQPTLADRLKAIAPWRGSASDMAQAIDWDQSPRLLTAEIGRIAFELAAIGLIVAKTGRVTRGSKLAEWEVLSAEKMPTMPTIPTITP